MTINKRHDYKSIFMLTDKDKNPIFDKIRTKFEEP